MGGLVLALLNASVTARVTYRGADGDDDDDDDDAYDGDDDDDDDIDISWMRPTIGTQCPTLLSILVNDHLIRRLVLHVSCVYNVLVTKPHFLCLVCLDVEKSFDECPSFQLFVPQ